MDDGSEMVGREIGQRYLIRSVLGRGGNAVVFRATDAARGGDVALKLHAPEAFDAQTAEAASHFAVGDGSAALPLWEVHPEFLEGPAAAMPIMKSTLAEQGTVLVSTLCTSPGEYSRPLRSAMAATSSTAMSSRPTSSSTRTTVSVSGTSVPRNALRRTPPRS